MDKNKLMPVIIFIFFLTAVLMYNYYVSRKRTELLRKEIKKNFGIKHTNKYKTENIRELYDAVGGNVDETTFNDLNLISFIDKFNHTVSTPGVQALYLRLRNIRKNREEVERIIERRRKLDGNRIIAEKIQLMLADVGSFKDSVLELLLEKVEINDNLRRLTYVFSFTLLYIIAGFAVMKKNFIFFAVLLLIINTYLYKYFNKMTYGSLNGLINLRKVLKFARDFQKEDIEIFCDETQRLKVLCKKLDPLYKSISGMNIGTGNIDLDFIEMYLNVIFLIEARKYIKSYKYIENYKDDIYELYEIVGNIDAEVAMFSVYKAENLADAVFIDNGIKGINLCNPLLKNPVPNDFIINSSSMLLTGSNASGKSTYLRTVGINMILSHTYGFVFGESLETEYIKVKSSIDISDSILENVSYFMAEAREIKKIIDSSEKKLILLDEIFKGTNTIDRISAGTSTLKYISQNNCVIAATHDIELTENLKDYYDNYHFEENIVKGDIEFDYKLKEGPAVSRNAIGILESLDYPDEVIAESRNMAEKMEKNKEPVN